MIGAHDSSRETFIGRISVYLYAAGLASLTLWLYWPATGYDFLNFDDDRYVLMNQVVRNGLSWAGVRWALQAIYESYWLPVMWLSYMLDSTLFGTTAFGYHFTNVALHAVNAALLFLLVRGWTKAILPSLFVAAFFAWHPLRVESVAWISERKDVLSGLFFLLSLLAYTRYSRNSGKGREAPAALFMALGLLTKPILVTLPFLLLLLDYWPFQRWKLNWQSIRANGWNVISEKVLFWALMALFSILTYYTQKIGAAMHDSATYPWGERIARVPLAFLFYLKKIAFPTDLSVIYGNLPVTPFGVFAGVVVLLVVTVVSLWLGRRYAAVPIGWFWFLGLLVPVIGLVRVGVVHVADRFTYLPSIGLAISIAWAAVYVQGQRRWMRTLNIGLAIAVLAACAWQTHRTLPLWKNSKSLFEHALKYVPDSTIANNNYAQALSDEGRFEEALKHFERAMAHDSASSFIANHSLSLISLGRLDQAIAQLQTALRENDQRSPFLHHALATAWVEKGRLDHALPHYAVANGSYVQRVAWHIEYANALYQSGNMAEASNEFAFVAAAGFPLLTGFDGLCTYFAGNWEKGERLRAWTFFKYAIKEKPDRVALLNNVAWFLATMPPPGVSPQEAVRIALQAKDVVTPVPPNVLDTLSVAYAANGQFGEAKKWAREAKELARVYGMNELAQKIDTRIRAFEEGKAWGLGSSVKH